MIFKRQKYEISIYQYFMMNNKYQKSMSLALETLLLFKWVHNLILSLFIIFFYLIVFNIVCNYIVVLLFHVL